MNETSCVWLICGWVASFWCIFPAQFLHMSSTYSLFIDDDDAGIEAWSVVFLRDYLPKFCADPLQILASSHLLLHIVSSLLLLKPVAETLSYRLCTLTALPIDQHASSSTLGCHSRTTASSNHASQHLVTPLCFTAASGNILICAIPECCCPTPMASVPHQQLCTGCLAGSFVWCIALPGPICVLAT